jgi:hypothetical protein
MVAVVTVKPREDSVVRLVMFASADATGSTQVIQSLKNQPKADKGQIWLPCLNQGAMLVEQLAEAASRNDRRIATKFGWDKRFGLWKLNPLADWDDKRVWTYIKDHHVPYNPLHDHGYPSIGCTPCTSKPDGDARSGRWAGTDRTECGING